MKSYTLNETELRWVLSKLFNNCDIEQFDKALKEYRATVLTSYNKSKNETTIQR